MLLVALVHVRLDPWELLITLQVLIKSVSKDIISKSHILIIAFVFFKFSSSLGNEDSPT